MSQKYQYILRKEFEKIRTKYGLINIDDNKDVQTIYNRIQSKIDAFLKIILINIIKMLNGIYILFFLVYILE